MSANNQTLVVEHNGKWLVYENIMAETWCSNDDCTRLNELNVEDAESFSETKELALMHAHEIDHTEYGVRVNELAKDGATVNLLTINKE